MSSAAHQSLKPKNRAVRETRYILSSSLDTIEACGGGSARCMMAEFSCQKQKKRPNIGLKVFFFIYMLALYIRFVLLLLVLN
jgi:hypothetical protein